MARNHPITFVELMTTSVRALWKTSAHPEYYRGPLSHLLDNGRQYSFWEAYHARHMREVADCSRRSKQATALRKVAVSCIHRRGLMDYLRTAQLTHANRVKLFEVFYGPTDYHEALVMEHRQYVLAASSGYCVEVLVDLIEDADGMSLLDRYQRLYTTYFQIFSQYMQADYLGYEELAGALRPTMLEHRAHANRVRRRIMLQPRMRAPVKVLPSLPIDRIRSSATLR